MVIFLQHFILSTSLNDWPMGYAWSIFLHGSDALRTKWEICYNKFPLSLKFEGYRENNKYRSLSWKPCNHVRILITTTRPISLLGAVLLSPLPFLFMQSVTTKTNTIHEGTLGMSLHMVNLLSKVKDLKSYLMPAGTSAFDSWLNYVRLTNGWQRPRKEKSLCL